MNVFFCLSLFCCLLQLSAVAQDPVMRQYTVADGLPSSLVYYTFEDSKGFIWIGTDMGVSRFDGYEFKTFTVLDGLPSNEVWRIQEDGKGRIWLSTFSKMVYIKDDEVVAYDFPLKVKYPLTTIEHKIDAYFNHLVYVFGHVYFQKTNDSIVKFQDESIVKLPGIRSGIVDEAPFQAFFDQYRKIAGPKALDSPLLYFDQFYYSNEDDWLEGQLKTIWTNTTDKVALIITRLGKTKLLVSNKGQVTILDTKNKRVQRLPEFDGQPYLRGDFVQPNLTWVFNGSRNSMLDSMAQEIPELYFLKDYKLNTLFKDRQDNLWANTSNGTYFLSAKAIHSQNHQLPNNYGEQEVLVMCLDEQKRLWLGGVDRGLYVYEKDRGVREVVKDFMPRYFNGLLVNQKNVLYATGDVFLSVPLKDLLKKSKHDFNKSMYFIQSGRANAGKAGKITNVKEIELAPDGSIYFSTRASTSRLSSDGQLEVYYDKVNAFIYAISIDEKGVVWTGKKTGLGVLKNGVNQSMGHLNPLFEKPINDLAVDKHGLWIATDGFGLFRYFEGQIDTIAELQNEIIKSIFVDEQERVWVATNGGVGKVQIRNHQNFQYDFQRLTTAHGLNSNEVNQVLVDDATIYVATQNGLSILDDNKLNVALTQPPVYFTRCTVNGKDTTILEEYDLAYNKNNINLEFVCLSYESQGNIRYEYKMDGVDEEWQYTRDRRKEYPLLPTGEYTFHLNAADINGVKAKGPIRVRFIIHPPWWQTLWFRLLAAFTFFGLVFGIAQYRIWQERKKAEEKAVIDKKFAELELQALQAQMNPHFVFNALHSIQDFIFNKNERVANAYLVKFSRLMRLFLDSSKEKFILLEDEIKLLQLYIDLEKLRFEEKFDYAIEIDPKIEPKLIEIPSMLLQPFVENSINHGLIYKDDKGLLGIQISRKENWIRCVIEDDGIGRKKATELKRNSYKSYKSRGMKLVEERQRVMNLINDSNIQIDIIDKEDEAGNGLGTKVVIDIPFFE